MTEKSKKMNSETLLGLTSQVVAAYVAHNTMPASELKTLIQGVYEALSTVEELSAAPKRPEPAVPIKRSIFPDYIVCLEDGRKLKMLKRHLKTSYNMSIEEYKVRWGLPDDYPVVAPNYAKQRSELAKTIGLGTRSARRRGAA